MVILEKIKQISYNIATINGLGLWKSGVFIASLLAFPILFFDRLLFTVSPTLFYWFAFLFFIFIWLVTYLASKFFSYSSSSEIVIDKILGMMITFIYIPLKWKLMMFGFVFFHTVNFFRPFILKNGWGKRIEELPLGFGILAGDIFSGLICNICLQIIFWIMA